VMAGPGIPPGAPALAQNVDLRPTFDDSPARPARRWTATSPLPLPDASSGWRDAALVEHHGPKVGRTTRLPVGPPATPTPRPSAGDHSGVRRRGTSTTA
jgi:hypothetical protein